MQIQRITRQQREYVITIVQNVGASSLTTGYGVVHRLAAASISATGNAGGLSNSATTGDLPGFVGVAAVDIAPNAIGPVVTWGYAASVFLSQNASSITIGLGEPLVPGAAPGGMTSAIAPSYAASGFKWIVNAVTVNTSVALGGVLGGLYTSGFVKGGF